MDNEIVLELHRALGRIEGKQDAILANQTRLDEDYETLRVDVDKLRNRINWYAGATAMAGSGLLLIKDKLIHAVFGA